MATEYNVACAACGKPFLLPFSPNGVPVYCDACQPDGANLRKHLFFLRQAIEEETDEQKRNEFWKEFEGYTAKLLTMKKKERF